MSRSRIEDLFSPRRKTHLTLEHGDRLGRLPAPPQRAQRPVPTRRHDPELDVVQARDGEVGGRRGHGHGVHDREGLGVEDVDGAGLGAEDEAGDGALLGVALLQGGDARDHGLTLERETLVEVDEGLRGVESLVDGR